MWPHYQGFITRDTVKQLLGHPEVQVITFDGEGQALVKWRDGTVDVVQFDGPRGKEPIRFASPVDQYKMLSELLGIQREWADNGVYCGPTPDNRGNVCAVFPGEHGGFAVVAVKKNTKR